MIRFILYSITAVITSFFFFPFVFTFFPIANTKMILAGIGLFLLGINSAQGRTSSINKDFLRISLWALAVSIVGLIAVIYNETPDYTYASYIVSVWVWLGGAYTLTRVIKYVHGHLSVFLVSQYLIVVCVAQCLIAYGVDQMPDFKNWVDSFLANEGFMGKSETRMYGIGASLDVAGMRFAAIMVIIACITSVSQTKLSRISAMWYLLSFFVIAIIGNMIGRTATVGFLVALACWFFDFTKSKNSNANLKIVWGDIGLMLLVGIPLLVFLYQTDAAFHNNIRFAFEGFFSLVENGRWEVHSNEILRNMYVFPDNLKTWIIGDGYIENPYGLDPYYTGRVTGGYYMDTDVGYLRFIFYFGVLGLIAFIGYFINIYCVCKKRFPAYANMFLILLALNFIFWFKVASDIFLLFAIFLCISKEENDKYEELAMESNVNEKEL